MTSENFVLIICGISGVIFHSLLKLNGLKKDATVGNIEFNWRKDYVKKDSVAIVMSFLSVGIWFLVFGEVSNKYPALDGFRRVSFVAMGAIGSYALQLLLGKAKSQIRHIVDKKTNELDGDDDKTKLPEPETKH
jgi:hypothetical protein